MDVWVSINFEVMAADDPGARVSVFDRSFLFGDSIYEVVRTHRGKLFTFNEHFERLQRSASIIGLELPCSADRLKNHLKELHHRLSGQDNYFRIVVSRGSPRNMTEINIDPSGMTAEQALVVVIAKPLPVWPESYYSQGIRLYCPTLRRNPRRALDPMIKSGNYLNNVMALGEARRRGYDDALLFNPDDELTESTTSNVFLVHNDEVVTPSIEVGLLDGITRNIILQQADSWGLTIREAKLHAEDLEGADECFLTSTTRGVMPVCSVDQQTFNSPGPLTLQCQKHFNAYLDSHLDD